jgi:RNA polymerase sigma factor (sigma-70 family)
MDQQIIAEQFISPEERTRLLHFCAKITGNPDVAEDMVQETLVEAWSHLQALRDPSRRAQWLTGIAHNVCLRWQRNQQREKTHLLAASTDESPVELEDLLVDDFDIEVELERKELIDLLDRALALLPAETRSVLVKCYVEESPLREVAAQLGLNVTAVAMRLQRGKLALRRVLTTDLRHEIAPYATAATTEQWEETPLWCDGAFFSVIEPAYIKQTYHSAVPLGLIVAAMGGAAFVGTLIFGAIGHRLPRRWTFSIGYTLGGSFRFWILLLPWLPLIIAWNILAGLCIAPINPLIDTVLQERLPAEMRARVFGSISAGVLIGIPLGTFAGGYVATWLGLKATLLIMGALYLLTTASLLVNPALKKM